MMNRRQFLVGSLATLAFTASALPVLLKRTIELAPKHLFTDLELDNIRNGRLRPLVIDDGFLTVESDDAIYHIRRMADYRPDIAFGPIPYFVSRSQYAVMREPCKELGIDLRKHLKSLSQV